MVTAARPPYVSAMLERMLNLFRGDGPDEADPRAAEKRAFAALLVMAAQADGDYDQAERALVSTLLARRFDLTPAEADALRGVGEKAEAEAGDFHAFTRQLKDDIPLEERLEVIDALWRVVLADGRRDPHEDAMMRRIADLLGVDPRASVEARRAIGDGSP